MRVVSRAEGGTTGGLKFVSLHPAKVINMATMIAMQAVFQECRKVGPIVI